MAWDERQVRMLQAMGLRVWAPAAPGEVQAGDGAGALATAPVPGPGPRERGTSAPVPAPVPAAMPVPAVTSSSLVPAPERAAPMMDSVSGLDWLALRQVVSACRACEMSSTRTQTVFGTGHAQAHWLVVGEAPDAEEDAAGEPFAGPAGLLLDAMLHALGLSRGQTGAPESSAYVVNALKCRPPDSRSPRDQEVQRCSAYLHRQIGLLQPRVLLAMGRSAAQALLRNDAPLGQLRGRVHHFGDLPVVVTYPPSYLLRNPGEKAKAWADLCLAAAAGATTAGR